MGPAHVVLGIHDAGGRLLRRLVDEPRDPGLHRVPWDGTDRSGRRIACGVYFYKLTAGGQSQTRSIIVVR
jgi:flagellar hook assembly protein FlgD